MPVVSDLVHETTTSTGTGALTLVNVNGKRSFNTAFGTGGTDLFDYFISHRTAPEWEIGTAHLSSASVLVRDTVTGSSNAGALVNFSAGEKDVANDVPAAQQVQLALAQTLTNKTINLANNTLTGTSAQFNTALSDADFLTTLTGQPLDTDLTSWALITRAAGFDTFTTTPSSANLLALVTDETGTGALVFGTSPVLTTPQINDTGALQQYIFAVSDLAADRTITLPLLTTNDVFVFEGHVQTLTNKTMNLANNSFSGTVAQFNNAVSDGDFATIAGTETLTGKTLTSPVLTTPQINDSALDHQYIFVVPNLAADRTVTLPLLVANDTFVFESHIQTLAGKSLTSPTITGTPTATGATWTSLGTVTTIDINGGAIDGTVIGGAAAAAGTFTTAVANSFVPNAATVPSNGMYLPAANTLGWAISTTAEMQLTAAALSPVADGGLSLGISTNQWANLFLDSGGVISFNNDVTITHAADALTFAGAVQFIVSGASQISSGAAAYLLADGAGFFWGAGNLSLTGSDAADLVTIASCSQVMARWDDSTASPVSFTLYKNSTTPFGEAGDTLGLFNFAGNTSTGTQATFAYFGGRIIDPANASKDGQLVGAVMINNTPVESFFIEGNGIRLATTTALATTPAAGAIEVDLNCFYGTTDAGNRGYIPVRHLIRADGTRTFVSNTNEQAIFNSPTNGTLTLETGTYLFEGLLYVTAMSGTSGNASIDILGAGTATVAAWLWHAAGIDGAAATAAALTGSSTITQQSAASILVAGTGTAMHVFIKGTMEVSVAGTVIPSLTMVTAAASIVAVGSWMSFERIGATNLASIGQWT